MEDRDIVELFWNRDPAAIRAVSEKYGKLCGTLARNILGSREDAEECVNDAFLNAWNAIPPARPAELAAFLSKIVRSLSFNRFRKNRAGKRRRPAVHKKPGQPPTKQLQKRARVLYNSE